MVDLDDELVLVVVVGHDIEDVVVIGVVLCETTLRHSNVESMDLEFDVDGGMEGVEILESFDLVVLVVFPPSMHGVSSCWMLIVVIVVSCSGVGLYAVSWLVCNVVSKSRQKLAGSITLIKLHAWCHLCGSL